MAHEDIVYWKSLDELRGELRTRSRRDFLTLMGFSVSAAAATVAATGCSRAPAQQAIPFASEPEEVVPGVANFYATTCGGCSAGCGLLVKTRDGRPIKVEGNSDSPIFGGGTCAVGQATVLSLYDEERLRGPRWKGQPTTWAEVDQQVRDHLTASQRVAGRIVLLSGPVLGPATREIIAECAAREPRFRHVVYEPMSFSALRQAHRHAYGRALVPHYRFDRAAIIVGLEADFLGTWLSPVEFTRQYASRRTPGEAMARHIQFESGLSLTGANADERHAVPPSAVGSIAVGLADRVAKMAAKDPRTAKAPPAAAGAAVAAGSAAGTPGGARAVAGPAGAAAAAIAARSSESERPAIAAAVLDDLAARLWEHRGKALIVCGVQDVAVQVVVASLNHLLEAPIELDTPSLQAQADDEDIATLIGDMQRGDVATLMVYGVNPAYDYVDADRFVAALARVPLVVSLSDRLDETAVHAHAVCPDHHFLEAWGDAEPIASYYSLSQPTVAPLFDTRAAQDSLLVWLGSQIDFHTYLRDYWLRHIYPRQSAEADRDRFWDHALQRGFVDLRAATPSTTPPFVADVVAPVAPATAQPQPDRYELHLYQSVALRDGRQANNPWLQELPDPITKLTWGNAAAIAPALAIRLGLQDGDVISVGDGVELPICIQPGQSPEAISIAVGYGRTHAGRVARGVGANAFRLRRTAAAGGVSIRKTGRREQLARTQTHHSMEGRPLVREVSLRDFLAAPRDESPKADALPTLWAEHDTARHFWGMTIDLNACTGCSACIIGCQAENNVPVVGKDEVRRGREMHWIRVDRYYRGPEAAPDTAFQPVMCQHCANAPCETVCPVLATVHSSDGLNQQVYNRCIGTRYCENNCPYKVRRFNWFTYAQNERFDFVMNSPLETMVLNPDVVVRSRGVMEKCSLCVQRIQAGKLAAKREGRPLVDGEIKTACQQACPAQAITFGDLHDPASVTASLQQESRHYHLLGDLGTRPSVGYLAKVRNRDGEAS